VSAGISQRRPEGLSVPDRSRGGPGRPRSLEAPARTAGFTLVELLVALVIASGLLGAIYQVLVTNQRISALQGEQVLSQQTVRAGLDLLAQELREVSASGGDLLTLEGTRVGFRAVRAFGMACEVVYSAPPALTVALLGRAFAAGDNVFLFAEGDRDRADDDEWFAVDVQAVTADAVCGTDAVPAQALLLSGPSTLSEVERIRRGAPIRAWEEVEYGLQTIQGAAYLVRVQDGTTARLVGPLDPDTGLELTYLDASGAETGTPTDVTRIRITIRSLSDLRRDSGDRLSDALATTVFLRN
jgi:prepilin-type N-terminal cleavage/methylation domain-containing protein